MTPSPTRLLWTYTTLLLTALIWGGTWIAGRVLVQEVAPFTAAALRFLFASLAMGIVVWRLEPQAFRLPRADWLAAFWLGLTGVFAYNFFFMIGLQHIAAGRGSLVVALNPVVVALAAWVFLNEPLRQKQWLGIAIALIGCVIVLGNGDPRRFFTGAIGIGELLIIGCVFAWTSYTLQCKNVSRRASVIASPLATNFWACASGCTMLCLAALVESLYGLHAGLNAHHTLIQLAELSNTAWACILYLGVAGSALSYTWYTQGIQKIGATRAAAFINFVPVFGVALGGLLLQEQLPASVYVGGGLILLGVTLTNRQKIDPPNLHSSKLT